MKKILISLIFLLTLSFPTLISAHGTGLPPFFKINGTLAPASPFQTGGVYTSAFSVPQDLAPQNYVKDEAVNFEIDTSALEAVLPKEVVDKTSFTWDFGDSSKGTGTKNTHRYQKAGSYILSITADYHQPDLSVPQFIESVQINILPNKDYQVPQAIIKINGKKTGPPLSGSGDIDLNHRLSFDASQSTAPSSKIVEYIWDFDDGKADHQAITSHRYKLPQYYVSPSLMVKDENGLISYTFTDIQNSSKNDPNNPDAEDLKDNLSKFVPFVIIGAILLLGGLFFILKSRSKPKSES